MIVVDSSVWVENLRNQQGPAVEKLRAIENENQILIGDIILLEILQGARDENHALVLEGYMLRFPRSHGALLRSNPFPFLPNRYQDQLMIR